VRRSSHQRRRRATAGARPPPIGSIRLQCGSAQLPAVAAQLDAAAAQAADYGATLRARHGLTDLRAFAVVALGVERLVWRVV